MDAEDANTVLVPAVVAENVHVEDVAPVFDANPATAFTNVQVEADAPALVADPATSFVNVHVEEVSPVYVVAVVPAYDCP